MPRKLTHMIVKPGKRPGKRLSKSKVFGPKFLKGKKSGYADLNLTAMVDMFTMMVIFLIMQFSADGDILFMSKDIKLPEASHASQLDRAPVVAVSADMILLEGSRVADIADLGRDEYWNIPALEEHLRDQKKRYEFVHQGDNGQFKGDVNIQADRKVPFKVIKRVMYSCNQAGYFNINFAVSQDSSAAVAEGPKTEG